MATANVFGARVTVFCSLKGFDWGTGEGEGTASGPPPEKTVNDQQRTNERPTHSRIKTTQIAGV